MTDSIWIEKYRPKSLDEVIGQEHVTKRLRYLVEEVGKGDSTIPHFLFSGPAGTGKTTVAQAFVRELYGEKYRMKELNASDERGIDVIRSQVKAYCQTSAWGDQLNIVFLDEADGLTSTAQEALRRIMEKYAETTRFILSCNYSNKIIDPVRGRCAILNFFPLSEFKIKNHLLHIAKLEDKEIDKSAANLIGQFCRGDLRAAVNALHFLTNSQEDGVNNKDVYDYGWRVDVHEVKVILRLCLSIKDIKEDDDTIERLNKIDKRLQKFYEMGYTNDNLVDAFYDAVKGLKVNPQTKAHLIKNIGELDYRLTIGTNPYIQVRAFLYGLLYRKLGGRSK